jgi:hypothetical protein
MHHGLNRVLHIGKEDGLSLPPSRRLLQRFITLALSTIDADFWFSIRAEFVQCCSRTSCSSNQVANFREIGRNIEGRAAGAKSAAPDKKQA